MHGGANGSRTRPSALKEPCANRCTMAPRYLDYTSCPPCSSRDSPCRGARLIDGKQKFDYPMPRPRGVRWKHRLRCGPEMKAVSSPHSKCPRDRRSWLPQAWRTPALPQGSTVSRRLRMNSRLPKARTPSSATGMPSYTHSCALDRTRLCCDRDRIERFRRFAAPQLSGRIAGNAAYRNNLRRSW